MNYTTLLIKGNRCTGGTLITCFLLLFLTLQTASAQGDLLITPRRVVFDGQARTFDLNLANIGKDTAKYSISMVQVRMKDDGGFETITKPDPGQRFADRYVRFFPRSVALGPNESQTVKIQLIRTGEMTPGEYRSHFYFRATPDAKPLAEEQINRDTTTLSVVLTPIFGITIPVIIKVGESDTRVTLSDLALEYQTGAAPFLKFTFNRTGNMSVYGDIAVDHISPQGTVTRVGIANGVAVYTPNSIRRFQLPLTRIESVDLTKGILKLHYSSSSDLKPEKYAEAELILR
ncbi:MAG: hypothetical protein JXR66_12590 [Bacteroidales bacterium]|nr:hypothetical protein [Bacteroidales bacterium]